jgi:hypothetical protein
VTDRTFHTGPPAFTSLLPAQPAPHPVSETLARSIREYSGGEGEVLSLGAPGATVEGRYLVRRRGEPLFLKVFDARILELQQHANAVAAFLAGHGVPVVQALPGEPRPFSAGYFGELFPYLETRFADGTAGELSALGGVLARVHRALAGYASAAIMAAAEEMHRRLLSAADTVLSGRIPREAFAAELRSAAHGYAAGPLTIHQHAQMIHGDCNYTNVLFAPGRDRLFIIDFEETRAAWLNPMFDVAKVIERFVLVRSPERPMEVAAAFIDAYAAGGGPIHPVDLTQVLVESNDRALMIMCDKTREGLSLPLEEWRKFVQLKALAGRQRPLLDALSRRLAHA